MTRSESTSAQIAAIAARGIKSPASLKLFEIQAVCASALTQVEAEAEAAAGGCPCPYHPIGCFGHPTKCKCAQKRKARAEKSVSRKHIVARKPSGKHKVSPEAMAWATREANKILRLTPEQNAEIIAKSKPFSELRKAVHAKLHAAGKHSAKRKGK